MKKALSNLTFRAGTGAVIINEEGLVLVFERRKIPDAWQFPQGGLDEGEKQRSALLLGSRYFA